MASDDTPMEHKRKKLINAYWRNDIPKEQRKVLAGQIYTLGLQLGKIPVGLEPSEYFLTLEIFRKEWRKNAGLDYGTQ